MPTVIHQDFVQSKIFSYRKSQLMMDAASDNSNRNGGAAMGMGEVERIASNLISRLLLVSDNLLLFRLSVLGECEWC